MGFLLLRYTQHIVYLYSMDHQMLCSDKINSRYELLFLFFCVVGFFHPLTFAQENIINSPNDPYVVKIYPDGTKLIVRWSEIGKAIDHGESHGGSPKIVSYNMAPDEKTAVKTNATGTELAQVGAADHRSEKHPFGGEPTYVAYEPGASIPTKDYSRFKGFYISPEIGAAVVQNINLNSISADGEVAGVTIGTTQTPYLTLSTGVRFNLAMGYAFNDWCSLEFAPGIIWNPLKTYGDDNVSVTVDGENYAGSAEVNLDGSFIQVPLVANLLFHIPTNSPWRPFFGGGLGANYNYLNVTKILGIDLDDASGSCWSLGYQATAGLEYAFEGDYSIGFKYIFTGSSAQSFGGDLGLIGTTGSYTQSVLLDFKATF